MAITPLMPVYPRSPVRPVRGEGVYLYGEQGERYLDFAAGIAVNILGHGHPQLTTAIQDQAATLLQELLERHITVSGGLVAGPLLAALVEDLKKDFAALMETMALAAGMKLASENRNVPTGLEN